MSLPSLLEPLYSIFELRRKAFTVGSQCSTAIQAIPKESKKIYPWKVIIKVHMPVGVVKVFRQGVHHICPQTVLGVHFLPCVHLEGGDVPIGWVCPWYHVKQAWGAFTVSGTSVPWKGSLPHQCWFLCLVHTQLPLDQQGIQLLV